MLGVAQGSLWYYPIDMYKKDFDKWHPLKKKIDNHSAEDIPYYHERKIWFCSLGQNVGYEQDGKDEEFWRPVIIIKKYNKHLFFGIPLTSKVKSFPFYFGIGNVDGRAAMAIISQARPLSSKRLVNKIDTLNLTVFEALKKAASEYIFSSPSR